MFKNAKHLAKILGSYDSFNSNHPEFNPDYFRTLSTANKKIIQLKQLKQISSNLNNCQLNKRHPSRLSRNYLNLNFLIIGRHENIKMEQLI